jgi:HAD superfamily hydrolase (TIGR01509 family)
MCKGRHSKKIDGDIFLMISARSNAMNLKAVIFDMDGLLLDTERIALSTFIEACREYHFEPDLRIYDRCIGTTYARTQEILISRYGKDSPFDAVSKLWEKRYDEETLDKPVLLKVGARSLLRYLGTKGMKKAVVTSSSQAHAIRKLANAGILDCFQFVLCGDQISKGKPDPEIYLTACQKIGEKPPMCLALEDSDNGVRSAIKAGLKVIQVPDLKEPSVEIKALGHRIVKSLVEVEGLLMELWPEPLS